MTGWEQIAAAGMSLVQAGGGIYKGMAEQRGAAEAARVSREQASWERARAAIEAEDYRIKGGIIRGRDRAKRGASGVDLTSGTPLDVDVATTGEIEYGAETIMREGALRSFRLEQEAKLREAKGDRAYAAGFIRAGEAGLTAASRFAKYFDDGKDTKKSKTVPGLPETGGGPDIYSRTRYAPGGIPRLNW